MISTVSKSVIALKLSKLKERSTHFLVSVIGLFTSFNPCVAEFNLSVNDFAPAGAQTCKLS